MTHLDLFAGGGGAAWFGKLIGATCVGYVEKDEYCKKIIRARIRDGIFDDAPIFDDVRTFNGLPYRGRVDLLTAGFPCQPFSCAGKRQGESDERNMWPDTIRILSEVRPRYAILENVPGLLATDYIRRVFGDLAANGFDAEWEIISAADVGAPHLRKRLWIFVTDAQLSERRPSSRLRRDLDDGQNGISTGREESAGRAGIVCSEVSDANGGDGRIESLSIGGDSRAPVPLSNGAAGPVAEPPGHRKGRLSGEPWRAVSDPDRRGPGNLADATRSGFPHVQGGEAITEQSGSRTASRAGWWDVEPDVGRVADGVASRSDRLRALGNGWVPAVAYEFWRRVTA